MDRKTQKKRSQKLLAAKSRHARFITEYVKRKEPELYAEADRFFNTLQAAHPDKRDLTKTHVFLVKTTNFTDYRDYYNRKKLNRYKQSSTTTTTTTTITTTRVDSMELNIDLLTPEVVNENTKRPLQPMEDEVYHDLLARIRADPDLQPILEDMIAPLAGDIVEDPVLKEILDGQEKTPLEKELDDIVEDPVLKDILDGQEKTPLEKERDDMGYN